MNSSDTDSDSVAIQNIIARRGTEFVKERLADSNSEDEDTLTIVSNAGIHPIPEDYIRGEIYIASTGNLDFSSIETVQIEYDNIIRQLHLKLLEKNWREVYLFPFGHSTLCMAIKLAVFRTLRIETVDIFYFGNGRYDFLRRNTRDTIASSRS